LLYTSLAKYYTRFFGECVSFLLQRKIISSTTTAVVQGIGEMDLQCLIIKPNYENTSHKIILKIEQYPYTQALHLKFIAF
jgi:hypothetical protein